MSEQRNDDTTTLAVIRARVEELARDMERLSNDVAQLRTSASNGEKTRFERVWAFTTQLALPLVLLLGTAVVSLRDRVTVIESTRIPARELQEALSMLQQRTDDGPKWLRDALAKVSANQDLARDDLAALKERLIRLEVEIKR